MPSFSQHNLRLVVLGPSLLIVVMKFRDKFASLQQLNSPNSRDKFQICCIDLYYFDKISSEFCSILNFFVNFAGLPEFLGSVTTLNRDL